MADDLRGYTPFELFNKVLNTTNNSLQVDIVDATGVTVTVDSEFPAAATLADNTKARELLGWKPSQDFDEWVSKWKKDLGL